MILASIRRSSRWPPLLFSFSLPNSTTTNPIHHHRFLLCGLLLRDHISTKPAAESNPRAYSYLVDVCGLSPMAALLASKKLPQFKSTENPDSVFKILKSHGLEHAQIAVLVGKFPSLLFSRSETTVKPKLEFFREIGISGPVLGKLLVSNARVLASSLERTLIPSFDLLKSLVGSRENAVGVLVHAPWLLNYSLGNVAANVKILKNLDVPDDKILKLMRRRTMIMSPVQVQEIIDEVISVGLEPSNVMFVHAVYARSSMTRVNWERKVAVYKSFGWSNDEILLAFSKWPALLAFSEEKIRKGLDFFIDEIKMSRAELMKYPKLLTYSLEKTVIPRCCVLNILISRGIKKHKLNVPLAVSRSKPFFFKTFVAKYEAAVPEVLEAYQGKIKFAGLDHCI